MGPHLIYRPREAVVFGTVAGRTIRLATQHTQAGIDAWQAAARSGGTAAPHHITPWEHQYESRPGKWGTLGPRLTIAENSLLEVFDYPGEYAQRFDGVDKGGSANHRLHGRVVLVKSTKTGFPGGGICLHGPPSCGNPRCIVVAQQWESLYSALKAARQVSIVVEL
jgi:hypothetical protein